MRSAFKLAADTRRNFGCVTQPKATERGDAEPGMPSREAANKWHAKFCQLLPDDMGLSFMLVYSIPPASSSLFLSLSLIHTRSSPYYLPPPPFYPTRQPPSFRRCFGSCDRADAQWLSIFFFAAAHKSPRSFIPLCVTRASRVAKRQPMVFFPFFPLPLPLNATHRK